MIQILIQVDDEGLMKLSAPENQTMQVVGALETAKAMVLRAALEPKLVQPAAGILHGLPTNGRNGG